MIFPKSLRNNCETIHLLSLQLSENVNSQVFFKDFFYLNGYDLPTWGCRYLAVGHTTNDWRNLNPWWLEVSHCIIRYSFATLGRMDGWFDLPAQEDSEICWYDLHGMIDKPMCYHASNLGSIHCGCYANRSPYLLVLPGQLAFHSSVVGKWILDNTGTNSESSAIRVASIDHSWISRLHQSWPKFLSNRSNFHFSGLRGSSPLLNLETVQAAPFFRQFHLYFCLLVLTKTL